MFLLLCSYFLFILFLLMIGFSWVLFLKKIDMIFEWLFYSYNSIMIEVFIMVDWVSMLFIGVVAVISCMVSIFSVSYMRGDPVILRFVILVMLFVGSMVAMVLSPSLVIILFGWDMLGLVSYCLVIYYQSVSAYNSGMVTVLSNRVGDVGLLMAIGLSLIYGSWNMCMLESKGQTILLFMILLAALTKSAQMPFSSWLPMAMAAPTPVSALVHSSTLVTAGVYLIIRYNSFIMDGGLSGLLLVISVSTMLMSGLMANFEFDLKKIIALSTLSQLGLMMSVLGLGCSLVGFYHLLTHAIFKSLLFMSAGAIIHSSGGNQDIRYYGGLSNYVPFVMVSFYTSIMALTGYPFLAGFYSKDLIMEIFYMYEVNFILLLMMLLSLSLTVMYSLRLCFYVYYGESKHSSVSMMNEDSLINMSMIFLMFMSVVVGSMLNWLFFFDYEFIYLPGVIKMLTLMFFISGSLLGLFWMMGAGGLGLGKKGLLKFLILYFSSMWLLNYLHVSMSKGALKLSMQGRLLDLCWVELIEVKVWFYLKLSLSEMYYSKFKLHNIVLLHGVLVTVCIYLLLI